MVHEEEPFLVCLIILHTTLFAESTKKSTRRTQHCGSVEFGTEADREAASSRQMDCLYWHGCHHSGGVPVLEMDPLIFRRFRQVKLC